MMEDALLTLVRAGAGHGWGQLPQAMDWPALFALAERQGVTAIAWDAVEVLLRQDRLTGERDLPKAVKYDGFGSMLFCEKRYEEYKEAIASLAEFYASHGFRMMLLKGYGLSLNYPVPAHRPCGDIDIWLFGDYKAADAAMASDAGIVPDKGHHHHTSFKWHGYLVENHYDIVNVHAHRSSAEIEKVFKELAQDDSHSIEINGAGVYLPSADFHALFLLRHSISHFASTRLNLRQVLDWGFFVEKHGGEISWPWLLEMLDRFGMRNFFDCMFRICVEDLGFAAEIFPIGSPYGEGETQRIKARVLADILAPEFEGEEPSRLVPRVWFKYRRWRANAWKHHLCYPDSMLSSFFASAWAHLLKPKSI